MADGAHAVPTRADGLPEQQQSNPAGGDDVRGADGQDRGRQQLARLCDRPCAGSDVVRAADGGDGETTEQATAREYDHRHAMLGGEDCAGEGEGFGEHDVQQRVQRRDHAADWG